MAYLNRLKALMLKRPYLSAAVGIAVLVALWFLFLRDGSAERQTITVERQDFLEQISISGTVVPAQAVDLGFAQSGRIAGVYVKVGQRVSSGTLLAQIENGDLRAAVSQRQAALLRARAELASLQAGTRPEELAVTEAQIESDMTALAQASSALLEKVRAAYTASDNAVHNTVDQFFSNPRSSNAQLTFTTSDPQLSVTLQNDRAVMEGTLSAWQAAISAGTEASALSVHSQTALGAVTRLLSNASAALGRAIPNSTVSASAIAGYAADVSAARSAVDAASAALLSAETSQKSAAATLEKDKKSLELARAGSTVEEVAAEEAQVAAAQADLDAARANLAKTLVVAPFSGVITKMDAKTGEIVSPSTSQISLISEGAFQIETYIPEVSIAGLSTGNTATVTLDAYGAEKEFTATVVSVDPAETLHEGVSTYKTVLQFVGRNEGIRSGMTANVLITTRRVPNALVVPSGAIFERDGRSYVHVRTKDGEEERMVVLGSGATLIGNVEVVSGLEAGDVVIIQ